MLFSVLICPNICMDSFPFVLRFWSSMEFPICDLIQRIDKCIYVFSLWHSGVLANVGKYWQLYVCVLHLHCEPLCAFFINIFDMLVCFLVCFYVTIFAWLLLTFSQIWEFLYVFCIYMVGHLVCIFYINIFDNMVCFLVCFNIKMFVWLIFPLLGVPLHSLYTNI